MPSATVLRMRDAIFALVADVAGLPGSLSISAEAFSSTDFIIETNSGLKSPQARPAVHHILGEKQTSLFHLFANGGFWR